MATEYKKYEIASTDEIVLGLLSMYSFESFQELDEGLIAYISKESWLEEQSEITDLLATRTISYSISDVENKNWNAQWESSFQPIIVGDFCSVRADFHDTIEGVEHDLIINPKMAFGTGHHETTYMMMEHMSHIDFAGRSVLDYGCGTGILAILASRLGAADVLAIDIEEEAYINTVENAQINKVKNINAKQATLDDIEAAEYHIILANINRNVLLDSAAYLYNSTLSRGCVLLSGILKQDADLVVDTYIGTGFQVTCKAERGEWVCLKLSK